MAVFKCKMCGANLEISENTSITTCDYCSTTQTLPIIDDEERLKLFERANEHRLNNEFDKATSVYEIILSKNNTDCEAYWGIVLSKFGIEYVKDPVSGKRLPTVNRCQYTSILDDSDYKNVLLYADNERKPLYEQEAKIIDDIQRHILAISQNEAAFDIFISCKETDSKGVRTIDSVKAQELYEALTQAGYKVFFARITLESKLGEAYEPYIFAALNSAKVMLCVGSSAENFNAVWVRNEWSRFLSIANKDKTKRLVPVYVNMSPYDMPNEFKYLEGQDAGKVGFIQDIMWDVAKIVGYNTTTKPQSAPVTKVDNKKTVQKPRIIVIVGAVIVLLLGISLIPFVSNVITDSYHEPVTEPETLPASETISETYTVPDVSVQTSGTEFYVGNNQNTYIPPQTTMAVNVQSVVYGPGNYTIEIGKNESIVLRGSYEYASDIIKKNNKSIRIQSGAQVYAYETRIIKDPETSKYALKGRINYDGYDGWCFIKWVNSVDRVPDNQPGITYTNPSTTTQAAQAEQTNGVVYRVDTLDNSSVRFSESYEWGSKSLYDGKQAIYIKDGTELVVYETVEVAEKGGGIALKGKTTYKGQTGWCFLCWIEPPPQD